MSTSRPGAGGLPRLAFAYHPRSFATMSIAEAAEGVCEVIWLVDRSDPDGASMSKLLSRIGEVIDVTGMAPHAAAGPVAAARPDGILALADSLLVWTAELAELLGLAFISPRVAERLTDKHAQRSALLAAGVDVPGFWPVPQPSDEQGWLELEHLASFPAVLKPRRGEGSRDTVLVGSLEHTRLLASRAQPEDLMVLEQYLADRPEAAGQHFADYVSVESIVSGGRISHLAVTGRFPPAEPFRETGFFIPSAYGPADRQALLQTATAAVEALGVEIGALHTEIKMTPEGPRVIELNGRIGGGVPEMLADSTGLALMPMALRIALGERIVFEHLPPSSCIGYLLYVQAPAEMRTVRAIEGLEALRARPEVLEVTLNRGPGASVDPSFGNHGHVFSVRGAVGDHDALVEIERRALTEVEIVGDGAAVANRA